MHNYALELRRTDSFLIKDWLH